MPPSGRAKSKKPRCDALPPLFSCTLNGPCGWQGQIGRFYPSVNGSHSMMPITPRPKRSALSGSRGKERSMSSDGDLGTHEIKTDSDSDASSDGSSKQAQTPHARQRTVQPVRPFSTRRPFVGWMYCLDPAETSQTVQSSSCSAGWTTCQRHSSQCQRWRSSAAIRHGSIKDTRQWQRSALDECASGAWRLYCASAVWYTG